MKIRVLFAALLVSTLAPGSGRGATLVMLPSQNLSGQERAPREVEPMIAAAMEKRGWAVVRGDEIEGILDAERVRYLDSLDSCVREKILETFGADAILYTSIYAYNAGRNPLVALSARLSDASGRSAWENLVGLTADDTQGMFRLSRINSREALAVRVVDDLLKSLPGSGKTGRVAGSRAKPWGKSSALTYVSSSLSLGAPKLCVLPLENFAEARLASSVLGEILALRLESRFDVVEAGEVRRALVDARIRSLRGHDPESLRNLGRQLGASLFLTGTIFRFKEVLPGSGVDSPELDVQLTLTDVEAGKVVWTSAEARKGSDYARLLQFGAISNVVTLADQLFAEIVRAEEQSALRAGGKK